jgi:hypothetical protein
MTAKAEQKSFATAEQTREFERGTLDLLRIGGAEIGRLTATSPPSPGAMTPGWSATSRWLWSTGTAPVTMPGAELSRRP